MSVRRGNPLRSEGREGSAKCPHESTVRFSCRFRGKRCSLALFDIRRSEKRRREEAIPIQENSISSDCSEGKVAEEGRRATVSRGGLSLCRASSTVILVNSRKAVRVRLPLSLSPSFCRGHDSLPPRGAECEGFAFRSSELRKMALVTLFFMPACISTIP